MRFKINVIKNQVPLTWEYDTEDNGVYDENGVNLNPRQADPIIINEPFSPTENPNYKTTDITDMYLILGFNCNFDCEYCSQKPYKNVVYSGKPSDVAPLIESFKSKLTREPDFIKLWGGEPLVYWKTLKVLVPALKELWPNTYLTMTTNGSLLNKENVDFFKQYDVNVLVSYDCNIEKRHEDVMETNGENILYAKKVLGDRFNIWATLTPNNCDPVEIFHRAQAIFGEDIRLGFYPLKCKVPEDVYTDEQAQKVIDGLYKLIESHEDQILISGDRVDFEQLIYRLATRYPLKNTTSHCQSPYKTALYVGMNGDVYSCANRAHKEGNISELETISVKGLRHWSAYEYCRNCPLIHICGGNCHSNTPYQHALSCGTFRPFYEAMFKLVFSKVFGVYVTGIEYKWPRVIPIKDEKQTYCCQ